MPGSSGSAGSDGSSVAAILCTRNRPGLLAGALGALSLATRAHDEVLVVDSASDTQQTQAVAEEAGFRVLRVERPGLSRARNAGVAATSAPVVLFTDDDCLPQPGWAEAVAAAFSDPAVGLLFGRVVSETVGGPSPAYDPGPEAFVFGATDDPSFVGVGACMAVRRQALDAVGGFDEKLGAGTPLRSGEDQDLAWRVLRAGWTGTYQPSARVLHRNWRAPRQLASMYWSYGLGAGAVAAKLIRADPGAGWPLLARRLGPEGLAKLASNVARRWKRPALESLLYTCGVLAGAARGSRLRLE